MLPPRITSFQAIATMTTKNDASIIAAASGHDVDVTMAILPNSHKSERSANCSPAMAGRLVQLGKAVSKNPANTALK